jgi:UV DNA damage endonuclease
MRLGLCCLLLGSISSEFKSTTVTWAKKNNDKIYNKLKNIYDHNLNELCKVVDYCINNNIWHYRISSSLFPLADLEPYSNFFNDYTNNKKNWEIASIKINEYITAGGRFSMHPSQFCIITNADKKITNSSLANLEMHADIMSNLGIPETYQYPINIHLSNGKKPQEAINAALLNMDKLSSRVRSRLVFENEDKSYWTWQKIHRAFPAIPITLDYHHRLINNEGEPEWEAHQSCTDSWTRYGIKPLFHYSEGKEHSMDRSHSDYIKELPRYSDIDLEIEAKQKNLAILDIRQKHYIFD